MVSHLLRRLSAASVLLILLVVATLAPMRAHASENADLLTGNPTITKLSDADTHIALGPQCTNMTVQVMRNIVNEWIAVPETHCMISAGFGLIDNYTTIIQPLGMPKSYPLAINRGGHPVLLPINGSSTVLLLTNDTAYPGLNVGIYDNLFSHLKFTNNPLNMRYTLVGEPDSYLTYPNGRPLAGNLIDSTLSFSNAGKYMVVDGVFQGFERVDLGTSQTVTFAEDLPRVDGYGLLSAATAITNSRRYAAVAYNAPGGWGTKYLKIIDVNSCSTAIVSCKKVDVYNQLKTAVPTLGVIDRIDFSSENSLLVTARYDFNGTTSKEGQFVVTPKGIDAAREEYLAVGDSYISGEGAGSYLYGTDTRDNKCHQSLISYPYLLGVKINSVASVACSGASMNNIIGNGDSSQWSQLARSTLPSEWEKEQALATHLPGYLLQKDFVYADHPNIVTVSIGGNDIGFADIVAQCISPLHLSPSDQTCYRTYEEREALINQINGQFNNLVMTYNSLKQNDPGRRIYVIGYPQIVNPEGACGMNVHLNAAEAQFAVDLVDYLDSVIEAASVKSGVSFVDTRRVFDGHRLCDAGKKAINGLTKGDDKGIVIKPIADESYHPNAYGHKLLADFISKATNTLTVSMPAPQNVPNPTLHADTPLLRDVPVRQALIYNVTNVNTATAQLLFAGSTYTVPASSSAPNLAPNSAFDVVLHSEPTKLGSVQTDANGIMQGSLRLPTVDPGFHTLHYYGKNIAGEPVDIQDVVYIAKTQNDYDGDGVNNGTDSCPSMPQSGKDADKDGIDDACDGDIGAQPQIQEPKSGNTQQLDRHSDFVFTPTNTSKVSGPKAARALTLTPETGNAQDVGKVLGLHTNTKDQMPLNESDHASHASNVLVLWAGIASIILITGMTISIAKSRTN